MDGFQDRRYTSDHTEDRALSHEIGAEGLVSRAHRRLAVPSELTSLAELDVLYEEDPAAIWTFMRPSGRPSFTPHMLGDFERWQDLIGKNFGPDKVPLRYLLLGSRAPGVFCFGGDLELFAQLIQRGDRDGLRHYGYRCVRILERNIRALDLPLITIGLVQGQALGGGFEALLSFDFIIAERSATFGLPEIMFGLFPGMGAHAILTRKLGAAMADRLILSQETWSAERMYELGLVHQLVDDGEGIEAAKEFMAKSERKHSGLVAAKKATRIASPTRLSELCQIVDLWADAALELSPTDLKLMKRLAAAQTRLADKTRAA